MENLLCYLDVASHRTISVSLNTAPDPANLIYVYLHTYTLGPIQNQGANNKLFFISADIDMGR